MGPIVEIALGKLRGNTADGIHAFKGVPYGAPTGGANRFMPPRPPEKWAGVRDAVAYSGHAPQLPGRPERRPELRTILGPPDATAEGAFAIPAMPECWIRSPRSNGCATTSRVSAAIPGT